jgi:hypothetical protein
VGLTGGAPSALSSAFPQPFPSFLPPDRIWLRIGLSVDGIHPAHRKPGLWQAGWRLSMVNGFAIDGRERLGRMGVA